MVSFFGIRVGGKKKKAPEYPDLSTPPPKKADQNAFGEGQFFGKNVGSKGVVNGSIREGVSRPGTAASARPGTAAARSPYIHDTHNFAASSMYDLSNASHTQLPTLASLKGSSSAANLGTFGNSSSVSLGPSSLPRPNLGFSSRPASANGKAKPWVNPLDVHYMRSVPSGPPGPKSPLGQYEIPPTPKSSDGDGHSLFGDKSTDNVVDDLFASIEQKEKADKEARERAKEEAKRQETEKLEKDRLERQKSTETLYKPKSPSLAPPAQGKPVFRGNPDSRSASPAQRPGQGPSRPPGEMRGPGSRTASPAPGSRVGPPAGPMLTKTRTASPGPRARGGPVGRPRDPNMRNASPGPRQGPRPGQGPRMMPSGPPGSRSASPGPNARMAPPSAPGFGNMRSTSPGPGSGPGSGPGPRSRMMSPGAPGPRSTSQGPRMRNASFTGPGPDVGRSSPALDGNGQGPRPRYGDEAQHLTANPNGDTMGGPGPALRSHPGDRSRSPAAARGPSPAMGPLGPAGSSQQRPDARGPLMMGNGSNPDTRSGSLAPNSPLSGGSVMSGPVSPSLNGPLPSPRSQGPLPSPGLKDTSATSPSFQKFPPPSGPPPAGRLPQSPGEVGAMSIAMGPNALASNTTREDGSAFPLPPPRSKARPNAEEAKPVIQNVRAKRETVVVDDSKRLSLSMKIEELEKSLVEAQVRQEGGPMRPEPLNLIRHRSGSTSSHYSDNDEDDDEDDTPISPIVISPVPATVDFPAPLSTSPRRETPPSLLSRDPSPTPGGPSRLGKGVHRPRPSEYGVKPVRKVSSGNEDRPRATGSGSESRKLDLDNKVDLGPHKRAITPQMRSVVRPEDTPGQSPEPMVVPRAIPETNELANAGFQFGFNSTETPPTPDSPTTSWAIAEPTSAPKTTAISLKQLSDGSRTGPNSPESTQSSKGIRRSRVPAPLNFDFSPSASTRAVDGLFTPQLRTAPQMAPTADGRPQTAGVPSRSWGRLSPTEPFPHLDDESPVLEPGANIIKGLRPQRSSDGDFPARRPNHGLMSPTGIADQFGTRFV